jgi:hypothetical protein
LNFLEFRLQAAHVPHLADLLHSEGQRDNPNQQGKEDYRNTHLTKADDVQHDECVEHRPNYKFGPDEI